jgi:hypothetical protein
LCGLEEYTKKVEIWKSWAYSLWSEHEEVWGGNMLLNSKKEVAQWLAMGIG